MLIMMHMACIAHGDPDTMIWSGVYYRLCKVPAFDRGLAEQILKKEHPGIYCEGPFDPETEHFQEPAK